ncbi:MAG: hypothetical protein J5J06_03695 [Phycisphaerae bacterium]|nr:hypothetical protein [Phycisphaerae bacterium]
MSAVDESATDSSITREAEPSGTQDVPRAGAAEEESPYTPMFDVRWRRGVENRATNSRLARLFPWLELVLLVCFLAVSWASFGSKLFSRPELLVFVLIFIAYVVFVAPRQARWGANVKKLVPMQKGLVCPVCVVPLETTGVGARCPKCEVEYAPRQAEMFWEAYGLDSTRATALFYDLPIGRRSPIWARLIIGIPAAIGGKSNRHVTGLVILLSGSFAVAMTLPLLFTSIPFFFPFIAVLTVLSAVLFMVGRGFRVGDELHCLKCDYQMAPQGRPSPRCPECGADWTKRIHVARGRQVRRPMLMVAGIVIWVSMFGAMFFGMSGALFRSMPTSALLWIVTGSPYEHFALWDEVEARTLTTEQTTMLAKRLLDTRLRTGELDRQAERWLSGMVTASAIPKDLIGRYYNEACEMTLEIVSRDRGRLVLWPLVDSRAGSFAATSELYLVVEGLYVNGKAVSPPETEATRVAWFCTKPSIENGDGKHIVCPQFTVENTEESPLHIELAYWLLEAPTWLVTPVSWTDDLTPVGGQTLTHVQRFVARLTEPPQNEQD